MANLLFSLFIQMKALLLFVLVFISFTAWGQQCEGLQHLNAAPVVVVKGLVQKNLLRKSSLDSNDLFIVVRDTSYRVVGFIASSECPTGSVVDIMVKRYTGNKINKNDLFVRSIRQGNHLYLECINVEKDGKRFLIKSVSFEMVD